VLGLRSQVQDDAYLKDTVVMGADYFEDGPRQSHFIPIGIGKNSHVEGALIDKNVRIGKDVVIKPFPEGTEEQFEDYSIRDGIVVIPKNVTIPDGTIIAP
jgi:glucose-1-phosphate adenylyltransferase